MKMETTKCDGCGRKEEIEVKPFLTTAVMSQAIPKMQWFTVEAIWPNYITHVGGTGAPPVEHYCGLCWQTMKSTFHAMRNAKAAPQPEIANAG